MNVNVSNYDVLYISNLCFNHNFNQQLASKLNKECKSNTIFASQDISLEEIILKHSFQLTKVGVKIHKCLNMKLWIFNTNINGL